MMHLVSIQYAVYMDHVSEPVVNTWVHVIDPTLPDQYQKILHVQARELDVNWCNDRTMLEAYQRHVQPVLEGLCAESLEDLRNALDKLCAAHKACWNERHPTGLIHDFSFSSEERKLEVGDAWFLDA